MLRIILPIGAAVLLTGCGASSVAYYTQTVQGWQGGNINDVQKVWGKPYEVSKTPGGNSVYTYKRQNFYAANPTYAPSIGLNPSTGGNAVIVSTPNVNTPDSRGLTAFCLTMFVADAKGNIVDTKVQGTNCYISQSNAAQLANPHGKTS